VLRWKLTGERNISRPQKRWVNETGTDCERESIKGMEEEEEEEKKFLLAKP
jgi:hypothetical protein